MEPYTIYQVWPELSFSQFSWAELAFLAFVALDDFLKQKLAFFDKN